MYIVISLTISMACCERLFPVVDWMAVFCFEINKSNTTKFFCTDHSDVIWSDGFIGDFIQQIEEIYWTTEV